MNVYLVSKGSYSDFRIVAAYTDQEVAKKAQELYDVENEVEALELDVVPKTPPGLFPWSVAINANGDIPTRYGGNPQREQFSEDFKEMYMPYSMTGHEGLLVFHVWARDADHAVKIVGEKRSQLIASNRWTTDWDECWKRSKEGNQ
jgi:hypothetical protein